MSQPVHRRGMKAPGTGTPKVPGAGTLKAPGAGTPKVPGAGTPKVPGTGTPKVPGAGTPKVPGAGTPKAPATGTPKVPATGTPKAPATGTLKVPGTGTPKRAQQRSPQPVRWRVSATRWSRRCLPSAPAGPESQMAFQPCVRQCPGLSGYLPGCTGRRCQPDQRRDEEGRGRGHCHRDLQERARI